MAALTRRSRLQPSDKQCPFCAETIKAQALRCRHCHADLSKKTIGVFAKTGMTVVVLGIVLLGFGAFVASSPQSKEQSEAQAAIDLCREREASYTGPANGRSIISAACQKIEDELRGKFGHAP